MGSASSLMDTTSDLDKKIQMVQLFRGMRGYGRTRYVQIHCVKTIQSEYSDTLCQNNTI